MLFFIHQQQTQTHMSSGRVIEIVDNTWPALQRAESIFGSHTDTQFRGLPVGVKNGKPNAPTKPKRSPT